MPGIRVCLLSPELRDLWMQTGDRPSCEKHGHASVYRACGMVNYPNIHNLKSAEWCGKHALVIVRNDSFDWIGAPSGMGGELAANVLQLKRSASMLDSDKNKPRPRGIAAVGAKDRNARGGRKPSLDYYDNR